MNTKFFLLMSCAIAISTVGCSGQPGADSTSSAEHDSHDHDHDHGSGPAHIEAPVAPSEAGEQYFLTEEPADALDVIEAREATQSDEEVVVFGQIGGSHEPFVDGRAMFTVVDDSLESCNEIPGDSCSTPWDYCCETPKLKGATALVKVVDENGDPIKTDARELLGVRELTSVIVKGNAQRDDAGNLTILASSIYVKK
ncbi:hypothetical protein KOR42_06470 [Thalassoglobus neptunius]|uniref:Uncharacterized protein n=1 Tax=Thalassoglobus neptunius TaxID=1938619 RepID=A0A5C5X3B0_9PLAN|nr:hypothetical protein [Thalassoglobus neptunius]TWT57288.1 hypothetical protein KOR42_06470 [Thalassoglobus neptunius]